MVVVIQLILHEVLVLVRDQVAVNLQAFVVVEVCMGVFRAVSVILRVRLVQEHILKHRVLRLEGVREFGRQLLSRVENLLWVVQLFVKFTLQTFLLRFVSHLASRASLGCVLWLEVAVLCQSLVRDGSGRGRGLLLLLVDVEIHAKLLLRPLLLLGEVESLTLLIDLHEWGVGTEVRRSFFGWLGLGSWSFLGADDRNSQSHTEEIPHLGLVD